jgi:hypothetical protein
VSEYTLERAAQVRELCCKDIDTKLQAE